MRRRRARRWTEGEKTYLRQNYARSSYKTLSRKLRRSPAAVCWYAGKLGLRPAKGTRKIPRRLPNVIEDGAFMLIPKAQHVSFMTSHDLNDYVKSNGISLDDYIAVRKLPLIVTIGE
jgi:hypothetical protein